MSIRSNRRRHERGEENTPIKIDGIPLTGAIARGNPLVTRPIEQPKEDASSKSEEVKEENKENTEQK